MIKYIGKYNVYVILYVHNESKKMTTKIKNNFSDIVVFTLKELLYCYYIQLQKNIYKYCLLIKF